MTRSWETNAEDWVRWTRTPGHDDYWIMSPPFFDEIVPPPGARTLEIGCGEGRVARDLVARGHRVVGVDASPTLLRYARDADPASAYVLSDAAALPFDDGSFDVVVAYNSLMDIDDMPRAVAEAGRVLTPDGTFSICITHPVADSGRFEGREPDAPFVIRGSYHGTRRFDEAFERNGLRMRFVGWVHPIETYFRALEDARFVVDRLREPVSPPSKTDPAEERWRRLSNFLHLRARKL
jgi:SAM-dependent methyltransferase